MEANTTSGRVRLDHPATTDTGDELLRKLLGLLLVSEASRAAWLGEYSTAETLLADLARDPQPNLQALDLLARVRAQQGFFPEAETLWTSVLDRDPGNASAKAALERIRKQSPSHPARKAPVAAVGVLLGCALGIVATRLWQSAGQPVPTYKKVHTTFAEQSRAPGTALEKMAGRQLAPGIGPVAGLEFSSGNHQCDVVFSAPIFSHGVVMTAEGRELIRRLAPELRRHVDSIEAIVVAGHTDAAVPLADSPFSDNYHLRLARAVAVVMDLVNVSNLPGDIFAATGRLGESPARTKSLASRVSSSARTASVRIIFRR